MNLYLINVDFPPIGGPGIWRIFAIAKYAALAGHRVTVFCSDRASWHDRVDQGVLASLPPSVRVVRVRSMLLRDLTDNISAWRRRTKSEFLGNFLKSTHWRLQNYWPDPVTHWALKTAFKVWRFARKERPDCIVTTGPQHLSHLAGYIAKKRLDIPWIMDYRDPWTGFSGDAQIIAGPYQARFMEKLENRFLASADAISVVSPDWLRLLAERGIADVSRFALIRNGHDLEQYLDHPPLVPATQLGPRPCHIHFNGTVQPTANLLPELLESVKRLGASGFSTDAVRFTFCGLPPSFLALVDSSPVRQCFIDYGPLSHDESVRRCLEADALLVTVRGEGQIQAGTIPAKTYEAMALGRHVFAILPGKSDARDLLDGYGNVTLAASTEVGDISSALARLLEIFKASGFVLPSADESARCGVARKYSRSAQVEEFLLLTAEVAARQFPARRTPGSA